MPSFGGEGISYGGPRKAVGDPARSHGIPQGVTWNLASQVGFLTAKKDSELGDPLIRNKVHVWSVLLNLVLTEL